MISLFCNHIIFSFPLFARIGSTEVFFVSYFLLWLLFFYPLEVCTGRNWRLEILSFLHLLFIHDCTNWERDRKEQLYHLYRRTLAVYSCLQYKFDCYQVRQYGVVGT